MSNNNNELLIRINGTAKDFIAEINKVEKKTEDLSKILNKTAKASAIAFAGLASAIALSTSEFASYEKALVGVGKTTDIEGRKLKAFGKEFQKLSSDIPIATNELLGIAQAAGQLGVRGEKDLLKFTETIAKLGVATDLTGEQGAVSLTRILNVTGEAISTIDTFGSVIVALGNNFAATESEIVRVTTEVARSTAVFGVSAAEAAGLATALKSVGVQAQLGGSAVGRAFREIDAAIRTGGKSLQDLSKLTGIAEKDLKEAFETNATAVFKSFIEGLGEVQRSGGSTTAVLAKFNLTGDEILKVLPVLAKNSDLFGQALKTAGDEAKNATALNQEAAKAFNTVNSEVEKLKNNATNAATNIGEQLAPAISELLKGVNSLLKEISQLNPETLGLIASFIKWGAIITGSLASVAGLAAGFLKLRAIVTGLSVAFKAGRLAVVGFTSAATFGLSAILAFLPEIITGVTSLVKSFNGIKEPKSLQEIDEQLKQLTKSLESARREAQLFGADPSEYGVVKSIEERIAKLKELRQEQLKASQGYGTGEMLIQPKADGSIIPDFGFPEQEIPLRTKEDLDQEAAAKASIAVRKSVLDEQRRMEDEANAQKLEKAKLLSEDLRALEEQDKENHTQLRKSLDQEDLDALQEKINTDKEAKQIAATEELNRRIAERNQFKQDEIKYGTEIATIKKFLNKQEVQGAKDTANQLVALTNSKNKTMKGIGKAAARVNAAIATAEGAIKAYASLSGIPIVGPVLGAAAAAALVAYGVEQQAQISALNSGGRVQNLNGGSSVNDSQLAYLTPNELVSPREDFTDVVEGTARQRGFVKEDELQSSGRDVNIILSLKNNLMDFIEAQWNERNALNISKWAG